MITDDMELVREYVRTGSEEAFTALVTRHVNLVYSVALRQVRDIHLAEEITQAVFVILAQKAKSFGDKTIVSGWLCRTARYVSANALTMRNRRQRREQEAYMQTTLNRPSAQENWQQIAPLLETALGRLNTKEHDAIVMRFFEGKALREVGLALDAGEEAARKRVDRALEKLRKYFARHGIDSTAAAIAETLSANSMQVAPVLLAQSATAAALAKGSVSTLTLAKGALKLMAWTKFKTTAVTCAVVAVTAGTVFATDYFWPFSSKPQKLPTGNVTPMVEYGFSHNVVILASDGSLWTWGDERLGWPVLGLGKVQNTSSLRRIGNDNNWQRVATGASGCLALKTDGSLWAWGGNYVYQLGDGTKISRDVPVRSVPGNDWVDIATSGDNGFAIKDDGTLWGWGSGYYLGAGDEKKIRKSAVQIGYSHAWTKIWADDVQTLGLQSDGSLWFWGSPTGDTSAILTPTRVSPDTNWVDVCFGYFTMFAIKSDGTLWSWGREANYYTGQDPSTDLKPMQVGTNTDWRSFASGGGFYHLLEKTDGSLWALDASDHRWIKPASEYKPIKLYKVNFDEDIAAFTAGGDSFGAVLTHDGAVWTWGNVYGTHPQSDFFGPGPRDEKEPTYQVRTNAWQVSVSY